MCSRSPNPHSAYILSEEYFIVSTYLILVVAKQRVGGQT